MSCLNDIYNDSRIIIGIRGYYNAPESGLFINDLPGMSLKTAAAIVNEEESSGFNLLKDKIKLATRLVVEDFKAYLLPKFSFNEVLMDHDKKGEWDVDYRAKVALNRGYRIRHSDSRLSSIIIKEVEVYGNDSGIYQLKITDGVEVTEYELNLIAGEKETLLLNHKCNTDEVYITLDNTNLSVRNGDLNIYLSNCGICDNSYRNESAKNQPQYLEVKGWNGESIDNNIYGMKISATLECDIDKLICQIIDKMYMLLLYKSGVQILEEYKNSNRLNDITLFTKDDAQALHTSFDAIYDKKYKVFIEGIDKYLKQFTDVCLTCRRNKYVTSLP